MAYEDLKKELQAIDTGEYTRAVGHVILKQALPGEAESLISGFSDEYVPLFAVANALPTITRDPAVGMGEAEALVFQDGFVTALVALKEMIDTNALNNIPTPPTIE